MEALLRRLGEVEVAAADVGAAIDDRDGDRAAAVAQPDLGSTGQVLVRDPEGPGLQGPAAREGAAIEARPIERGGRRAVDGDPPHRGRGPGYPAVVDAVGVDLVDAGAVQAPVGPEAAVAVGGRAELAA